MTARHSHRLSYIGILCLLGAATACNSPEPKTAYFRTNYASHTVFYPQNKKNLSEAEFDALNAFVQSVPVSAVTYAGLITDDSNPHMIAHARQLKKYLVEQGINPDKIYMEPSKIINAKATVILTLQYAEAVPPQPCPDWSKNAIANYNNTASSNFGCAYNNNLVEQMANPADIESGSGKQAVDALRDSVVIQKYRTAASAPMATVSASSPNTSSVPPNAAGSSVSGTGSIGSQ